eukprot:TRINITY_DN14529_c0_g1_i1.p1 TRINITY_DN14529_c0_g1~~TRINITY_DN14529_c0_g1_i1.p1  ORF type:complete len:615 (+),score=123.16 TRINITY_DN14529_c0_g1_i1:97-1941(+)
MQTPRMQGVQANPKVSGLLSNPARMSTTSSAFRESNLPPIALRSGMGEMSITSGSSMAGHSRKSLGSLGQKDAAGTSFGHQAMAAASHWLANAGREGKRSRGDEIMPQVLGVELDAKSLKQMAVPARRLVAASGALTARELRKAGAQDSRLLIPLNKEEREMQHILELISEKAAQKFRTVRAALRHVDADCDGTVDRCEVRYFFRAYDFPDEIADKFFDHLDEEGRQELDYTFFVNFLRPYLQAAVNGNPMTARSLESQGGTLDLAINEHANDETKKATLQHVREEFGGILRFIGDRSQERFSNVQHVFRYVDSDKSGSITRSEMRYFFRAFNLDGRLADRFFDAIDFDGGGEVSFSEFYKCLSPYISPDNIQRAKKIQKPPTPLPETAPQSSEGSRPSGEFATQSYLGGTGRGEGYMEHVSADIRTELRQLMKDIGDKLPLKFKHVRDAFRPLDLERNGTIKREELRAFFRGFGHPAKAADRVFDLLDEDNIGQINFSSFMKHFDSLLGPSFRSTKRTPIIPVEDPSLSKEVNDIAQVIRNRLTTKYSNFQAAFRALDLSKDGRVTVDELKIFIKQFNLHPSAADKFFLALDEDGSGYISYREFLALFQDGSV